MVRASAGAVVVGVDGSDSSLRAVDAAVRTAAERELPLRIVHAFVWPLVRIPRGHVPVAPPAGGEEMSGGLRQEAERIVEEARQRACAAGTGVPVEGEVVVGGPAAVLIRQSTSAVLLVLGDRGLGGFAGLLLGSVAEQVCAHAASPVMIVRGAGHAAGPVVVGVDGSATSAEALAFAADEAVRRRTDLAVLHAWAKPVVAGLTALTPLVCDVDALISAAQQVLDRAVADLGRSHPHLTVEPQLVEGRPAGR
ncbi:universal stress protein [Phytohabitans suffuscus]|uniref:Universal stress protein n=1 Tax=Phytohabitans suffuscus TaxID=624315 RepID=A0A6F8YV99_9ACTN|nr:universal stress protein [Phytohabitans suffuscus]